MPTYPILLSLTCEQVSKDAWASRITTITRVASSYSKPKLEMIWAILSFLYVPTDCACKKSELTSLQPAHRYSHGHR